MGTGYRPPSNEPKGRWAKHIHAVRRERGWSQTRGFEAVREGLGLGPKSRAAYIPLDDGRRAPSASEEAVLADVYGWPPESPTEPPERPESGVTGLDALVAAIAEQTRVMGELVKELRVARGVTEGVRERVAAVEAYAEEHERRLQADLQRGIGPAEDSPLRSEQSAGGRR